MRPSLTVLHGIERAPAIELVASFSKPKERIAAAGERHGSGCGIDLKSLDQLSAFFVNGYIRGIACDMHGAIIPGMHGRPPLRVKPHSRERPFARDQNQVLINRLRRPICPHGENGDAQRVRSDCGYRELGGLPTNYQPLVFVGVGVRISG